MKHDVFIKVTGSGIKLFIDGMLDDVFDSIDDLIDSIQVLNTLNKYDCTYVNLQLKKIRSLLNE